MKQPMKQPKRGRKSLLTSKVQKQICDLLAVANSIRSVCDATGIGERTYYDWCNSNPQFAQAVTRARGKAKIKLVKVLVDASALDWRSAAWLLERGFVEEYGKSDRAEATAAQPHPPAQVKVTIARSEHSDIGMGIMNNVPGAKELMKQYEQLKLANAELEHLTIAEKRARSAQLPPRPSS